VRLVVPRPLLDVMVEHARLALPNECCGLLVGHGDTATRVLYAENAAASPRRFEIELDEVERLSGLVRWHEGEEVLAVYHSHTLGPACPSPADSALALEDSLSVIVGVGVWVGVPVGVCVDRQDRVWVSATNNRVQQFALAAPPRFPADLLLRS